MSAELMMTDETVKKSSIIANFLQNYCPFSSFYKTTLFLSSSLNIDSLHVSHNFKMLFHCLQVFQVLNTNAGVCIYLVSDRVHPGGHVDGD